MYTDGVLGAVKGITLCLSQCAFVNGSHRGLKGENWVSSALSRSRLCFCYILMHLKRPACLGLAGGWKGDFKNTEMGWSSTGVIHPIQCGQISKKCQLVKTKRYPTRFDSDFMCYVNSVKTKGTVIALLCWMICHIVKLYLCDWRAILKAHFLKTFLVVFNESQSVG